MAETHTHSGGEATQRVRSAGGRIVRFCSFPEDLAELKAAEHRQADSRGGERGDATDKDEEEAKDSKGGGAKRDG